jgi:hypothetical protein
MIKPNNEVIKSIINLESNPFWKEIVKWLNASLIDGSIKNNKSIGEETIKRQGRNLELEDILEHISKARIYQENTQQSRNMEE